MRQAPFAIQWAYNGQAIALQPYQFHLSEDEAHSVAGKKGNLEEKELPSHLANCFIGWVDEIPVLISDPLDSEQKVLEWIELLKLAAPKSPTFHISLNQLASLKKEWWSLSLQKEVISFARRSSLLPAKSILHTCTPLDLLTSSIPPKEEPLSETKTYRRLLRLFNADAWSSYCSLFNAILSQVFQGFKYDAVDAYTLIRYIKDFEHEVQNPYLERTKIRLMDLEASYILQSKEVPLSHQESVRKEKEILIAREDIRRMLSAHFTAVSEIVRIIPIIETSHPRLKKINIAANILKGLLSIEVASAETAPLPFAGEQILLQLLNDSLGVISSITSDHGERAALGFIVRATALQLAAQVPIDGVIDLALNWNEVTKTLHRAVCVKGIERVHAWRSGLENLKFQTQVANLLKFWELLSLNLEHLFLPMTAHCKAPKSQIAKEKIYYNRDLLALLPPFSFSQEKPAPPLYLNYDPSSFEPVSLTSEAFKLFQ